MRAVVECMEDCRNAAVKAGFPPQCGVEMLQGCLQDQAQDWSPQQFEIWFTDIEAKYGQRSNIGISLRCVYRKITQLLNIYDSRCYTKLNSLPR